MQRRGSRKHCYAALVKLPFTAGNKGSSDLVQIFQPALAFRCIEPFSRFHASDGDCLIVYVQSDEAVPSRAPCSQVVSV